MESLGTPSPSLSPFRPDTSPSLHSRATWKFLFGSQQVGICSTISTHCQKGHPWPCCSVPQGPLNAMSLNLEAVITEDSVFLRCSLSRAWDLRTPLAFRVPCSSTSFVPTASALTLGLLRSPPLWIYGSSFLLVILIRCVSMSAWTHNLACLHVCRLL